MACPGTRTQLWGAVLVLAATPCANGVGGPGLPHISGGWKARIGAANLIAKHPKLTVQQKFAVVVGALRQEITHPFGQPGKADLASGYSFGEHLQVVYMSLLWQACGPKMIWEKVKALEGPVRSNPVDRELRKRLIIAFARPPYPRKLVGFAAEGAQAARELLIMLRTETYDFVRALAARGLGHLGAREAIPALKEALRDPAHRWVRGLQDVVTHPTGRYYMVRHQAALSLQRMDFKISSDDNETWTVEP